MARISVMGGVIGMMVAAVMGGCNTDRANAAPAKTVAVQENESFSVISVTPQGELPSQVAYPAIQVQFSEAVVALKSLGEPVKTSDVFTIEPKLNGVFRWRGTSLISFDAEDEAIPQKVYTIKINPNLTSLKGAKISGQLEYTFHTEELKLTGLTAGYGEVKNGKSVDQGSVPPELAKDIALFFNAPVNANVVKEFVAVSDGAGKKFSFSAKQAEKNCVTLSLNDTPAEDTVITVTLKKGAMADKDCYPTAKDASRSFHTLIAFSVTDCNPLANYYDADLTNPVRITFSSLLKQDSETELAKYVSTDLGHAVTAENLKVQGRTLVVHGLPITYESTYHLYLGARFFDVYGRTLGKPFDEKIEVPPARSYVTFKNSGLQVLESQFSPKIVFYYQNIKSPSKYTLEPLTLADGTKNNVRSVTTKLDPAKIEQNKRITETVDLCPFLEQVGTQWRGAVRFTAEVNYEYQWREWRSKKIRREKSVAKNEQIIQVTDLGVTARYAYNKAIVLVTSLASGKPVPNAEVNMLFIPHKDVWRTADDKSVILTKKYAVFASAKTNTDGLAEIPLSGDFARTMEKDSRLFIEAKTKDDRVMFSPEDTRIWRAGVHSDGIAGIQNERMVTLMFTDRGLYKPGETVTYRIVDRNLYKGEYSTVSGKQAEFKIELTDNAWRNRKSYFSTAGTLTENGTTWGKIALPADIKPGDYTLRYQRECNGRETEQTCRVQVQFFEKLRFEAHASIADEIYFRGDTLSASLSASYLGGGALDECTYHANWTRTIADFSPKSEQFRGMSFAPVDHDGERHFYKESSGRLAGDGTASVSQKTGDEDIVALPYRYRMEARVVDSSNQAIATSATALVHPAKFYLGVSGAKNLKGFAKKGDTLTFEYVCIAPDESAPPKNDLPKNKQLLLELRREEWRQRQIVQPNGLVTNDYHREIITEQAKEISLSGKSEKTECNVKPEKGGVYYLRLSTMDADGNKIIAERRFYVTSSDWFWHSENDAQEIGITADKDEYEVGETAQLMVQSALPKGTYLMTVEREGIISQKLLRLDAPTSMVSVPIEAGYVPVVYVSLSSYSVRSENAAGKQLMNASGKDEDKPKSYFGVTAINVSTKSKRFDVKLTTDKATYRAGEKAKITLHAEKNGRTIQNAEITVMAVDRGVLDLIDYHVEDPVDFFYARHLFPNRAAGGDSRNLLVAQEAEESVVEEAAMDMMTMGAGPRMMKTMALSANAAYMSDDFAEAEMDAGEGGAVQMKIRRNFASLALFLPDLKTDANGNVTCEFTLPDSLTSYRLTVIGIKEHSFAKTEGELLVAEPVSVRHILPRKLRLDDMGETGVTLTNLDDKSHEVSVSLALYDGIEKTGEAQTDDSVQKLPGAASVSGTSMKKISLRPKSTEPLMFMVNAKRQGWITLEFTVRSDVVNEQILVPLEIEKPYIFEAVTTIGEVRGDGNVSETELIVLPGNAEDGRGSLYVQLDPTRLGVLREAVNYVFHYPYGCMEQRSAAVLPLVAFGKYIKIFGLNSEVKNPASVAKKEIKSWVDVQNRDGGFPYWPDGFFKDSSPYVSMRIAEILALAKQNGVIDSSGINEAKLASYLIKESDGILKEHTDAGWSLYTAAYGYYAAHLLGGPVAESNLEKIAAADNADVEALALVALTYLNKGEKAKAEKIADKLLTFTRKTNRGIDITEKHGRHYWCFFNADCEKYALYLQLFTRLRTESDVNQRLVYELLKMQKSGRGYWQSTAVTSRILIALNDYIKTNKLEKLDFTAEALLNGTKLLDGRFKGVAAEAEEKEINFAALASQPKDKEIPLVFSKDGTGTLFYTASMKYAIPPEKQVARDEGLCIYTEITDAKTGERVTADKLIAGNIYREKVFISSTIDAEYVAVRAPIPAGAKIMNTAFVTTGTLSPDPEKTEKNENIMPFRWWCNPNRGLSYKGAYDSEVQFFWNYFPCGSQTVEFQFRATRKGIYHTPCATAECMYEEEIFGRTNGAVWKIE